MSDELEEDFETVKARVHEKMVQAAKLIEEANAEARKLGYSLEAMDYEAACDLKVEITDAGLEPEPQEAWLTSTQKCW